MNIQEYIGSGILELYLLDQLSPSEKIEVEKMANLHPEIKQELHELELTLEKYALGSAIQSPQNIKTELFSKLPPKNIVNNNSKNTDKPQTNTIGNYLIAALFAIAAIVYYMQWNNYEELQNQIKKERLLCDSLQSANEIKYQFVNDIKKDGNEIVKIAATPKFANTLIYLHTNKSEKLNYLQLNNLPPLEKGQAYQLWSLQEGKNPIPMEVFKDANIFVKVGFLDETVNYAITIENEKGSTIPNLENLLGVFKAS